MTGAPRPHHRNIYCIIYSSGPLVQGERTHINFQAGPSLLTRSCLLLKAEVPLAFSPSFFPPFVVFFSVHQGPEASTLRPDNLQPPSSLFIPPVFCFFLSCFHTTGAAPGFPEDRRREPTGLQRRRSAFLEEGRGAELRALRGNFDRARTKGATLQRLHKGPH